MALPSAEELRRHVSLDGDLWCAVCGENKSPMWEHDVNCGEFRVCMCGPCAALLAQTLRDNWE